MKKTISNIGRKFFVLALLCCIIGTVIPATKANAADNTSHETRTTQVTYLSGELKPYASMSKTFHTNAPLAVKVVYTSSAQEGDQAAPVTIYIDGAKVATSNGYSTGVTIWSLTAGYHTLKVVNGSVWAAFGMDIATL